jgi:hypothetical protein
MHYALAGKSSVLFLFQPVRRARVDSGVAAPNDRSAASVRDVNGRPRYASGTGETARDNDKSHNQARYFRLGHAPPPSEKVPQHG